MDKSLKIDLFPKAHLWLLIPFVLTIAGFYISYWSKFSEAPWSNGQLVKEFRLYHLLELDGYDFDYVFFVTNENGIIGSYCTNEGQQIIALRSGRIFEDVYDYSNLHVVDIK
jgi:hypothetical protein